MWSYRQRQIQSYRPLPQAARSYISNVSQHLNRRLATSKDRQIGFEATPTCSTSGSCVPPRRNKFQGKPGSAQCFDCSRMSTSPRICRYVGLHSRKRWSNRKHVRRDPQRGSTPTPLPRPRTTPQTPSITTRHRYRYLAARRSQFERRPSY